MTQPEFAGRIGISQTYLSDLEHGKFEVGAEIVIRIARFPPTPCFLLESVLPVAQRRRHCDCGTAEASHVARGAARRTRTHFAQEVPGIVAVAMSVVPVEAQRVLPDRLRLHRAYRCSQRPQVVETHGAGNPRLPALGGAPSRTRRTGTDRTQVGEIVMTAMPVPPFDVQASAAGKLNIDRLGFAAA